MIFRNDDVSFMSDFNEFKKVHEMFNEYHCKHTIAMLTKNIHKNINLINYINSQDNIDVQLHTYEHIDFVTVSEDEVRFQLTKSKEIIQTIFGNTPTVFYPTFNSVNNRVIEIAKEVGLETSYEKISILYYIRNHNNINNKVINFHYWDYSESILIEAALKLYNERSKANG